MAVNTGYITLTRPHHAMIMQLDDDMERRRHRKRYPYQARLKDAPEGAENSRARKR